MHIVTGSHKNRPLVAPKGGATRPTSARLRETLMNICQHSIEGADFLDLFAGSGAVGLEALSRGAASATFVDSSKESIKAIRSNVAAMQFENPVQVIFGDVAQVLKSLVQKKLQFDLIYVDPPYEQQWKIDGKLCHCSLKILEIVDSSSLLKERGSIFIEDCLDRYSTFTPFQQLALVGSRNAGRATLQQFQRLH